ncbi:MAG: hypothetical protein RIE56_09485 [Amphiplicatus sp.]
MKPQVGWPIGLRGLCRRFADIIALRELFFCVPVAPNKADWRIRGRSLSFEHDTFLADNRFICRYSLSCQPSNKAALPSDSLRSPWRLPSKKYLNLTHG